MIVYKYFPPEDWAIENVLGKCLLRFTPPSEFNDPFEFLPDFAKLPKPIAESIDEVSEVFTKLSNAFADKKELLRNVLVPRLFHELFANKFLILCLSKHQTNPLLWSHYSAKHTGFAIGFDSKSEFFNKKNWFSKHGLLPVNYSNSRPMFPSDHELDEINDEERLQKLNELIWTKAKCWKYEDELRMIAQPREATKTIGNLHLFQFPKSAVKEILLGWKIDLVENAFQSIEDKFYANFKGARLFRSLPHPSEYSMEFEDITNPKD